MKQFIQNQIVDYGEEILWVNDSRPLSFMFFFSRFFHSFIPVLKLRSELSQNIGSLEGFAFEAVW